MKEYLKKYKLYIIIGVSILILSVGGTLAYYIWSSNTNAIVNTEFVLLQLPLQEVLR